jgi:hypothetical protein
MGRKTSNERWEKETYKNKIGGKEKEANNRHKMCAPKISEHSWANQPRS